MFSNPIASYQKVGLESEVHGADPHRLIILLFDAAESAMHQGLACIENGDISGRSNALMKAIDIILSGLTASLNIEEGGELAQNLKALYDYIVSRLIYANIHQDPAAIKEAQKLLGEISGAWREMGQNLRQGSVPTP